MQRRLSLKVETLAELTTDELSGVAGAMDATPLCLTVQPTLCYLCQLLTRGVVC